MAIRVVCPQCAKVLQAPDAAAGRRARCPACKQVVTVPPLATSESARAPEAFDVADDSGGYSIAPAEAPPPRPTGRAKPAPAHSAPPSRAERPPLSVPRAAGEVRVAAVAADSGRSASQPPVDEESEADHTGASSASATTAPSTARRFAYLLFAVALLPLGLSMLHAADEVYARFEQTRVTHPEEVGRLERGEMSLEQFLAVLPDGKLPGAHLSRTTWMHWLYALVSASVFLTVIIFAFERQQARPIAIAGVGVATATCGIIFLLSVQFLAAASQGVWLRGGGIITLVFYIFKLIGFSYAAASNPENGFVLSFFGYTIGVGLCEEFTKALPVIFRCRNDQPFTWYTAIMWGLASGVGFGVAEGIMYSSSYYNGIQGGEIYLVRFVSCVALHAVWTAAVALLIWNNQQSFCDFDGWAEFGVLMLTVLGVPMVLHGLYDTLLKRNFDAAALAVAVVSFAWLAFLVEYTRRQQEE